MVRNTLGIKYFLASDYSKVYFYLDCPTHWYCFTDKTYHANVEGDEDETEKLCGPKAMVVWNND